MTPAISHLVRERFAALLDEILDSDDPVFGGDQYEFLEKRFFEIRKDIDELITTRSPQEPHQITHEFNIKP